jgi:hypothetical protein
VASNPARFASLLALSLCLWTPAAHGKGKEVTPLYTLDRQKMPHIDAVEYRTRDTLNNIFPVPERNSIGTNSIDNAITVITLGQGALKSRQAWRRSDEEVSGGSMVFLPPLSPDTIGYSQTRGFLIFNLKNRTYRDFIIGRIFQIDIEDVAVLDATRNLFLFNLDYQVAMDRSVTKLKVLDLTPDEPEEIASFLIENEPRWAVLGKTTFFFTREGERLKLHALDDRLRPVEHPLLSAYNSAPGFIKAGLPRIHPTLPLAIFAAHDPLPGDDIVVWAASWGAKDGAVQRHKLLGNNFAADFRFSPDGQWVWFRDTTEDPPAFVVMQVDPKLPQYFGAPILLRTGEDVPKRWNGHCAWISDPVSVVCTANRSELIETTREWKEIHKLLKWELSAANVRR